MGERESTFEDPNWEAMEFQSEELSACESVVARGQFWTSFTLGKIRPVNELSPHISDTMVMIKSGHQNELTMGYKGLKSEMNILYDLSHVNVIKMLGYCIEERELQLVFEYCANGNLKKVLQRGRPFFDSGTYCPRKIITLEVISSGIYLNFCYWHLLKWSAEIARGMEYLAFKGVVHSDLASRNILLTDNWIAKIGNFGISQRHKVQDFSNVSELAKEVLPLAWLAPEAIKNLAFCEKTDVWSYAVTLWEIFTLGEVPFRDEDVENDLNFVGKLAQGIRPPRAEHANENIWDLISSCWSFEPGKRPTFSKIKTFLERTVFIAKPHWEAKMSMSEQGSCNNSESGTLKKKKSENESKKVAFHHSSSSGGTESLFKKCVCAIDDALARHGLKAN